MKITAKGRCALVAMMTLSLNNKRMSIKEIAKEQDLSVRYLEQVFSLLKKSKLVNGTIGPSGGYALEKSCQDITVKSIIDATDGVHDFSLHSKSQDQVNQTLDEMIFTPLDDMITDFLLKLTLEDLTKEYSKHQLMYYI